MIFGIMNSKKWMLLAVFSFCVLAISVKEIDSRIHSFQIIFFRSLIGLLILTMLFPRRIFSIKPITLKKHFLRNIFHLIGQYGWIVGIIYLSIAEVTAIEFTVPIWVILFASFLLREKLTLIKIIVVVLGLIGVLFILKPGIEILTFNSVIVLISAMSYGITHILTKKIVSSGTAFEVVYIMCLIQMPISFAFALPTWETPSLIDYWWFSVLAISAISAHFSLAKAYQNGKVSDLIIIDYLRLPILTLVGILFYNELFSFSLIIGGLLIIGGNYLNQKRV